MEKRVFEIDEEDKKKDKAKIGDKTERQGFWSRLCRRGAKNKIGSQEPRA
jgi:hypothetical protein